MEDKFEIKSEVPGPAPQHAKQIRVLNRVISWTDEGLVYELARGTRRSSSASSASRAGRPSTALVAARSSTRLAAQETLLQ